MDQEDPCTTYTCKVSLVVITLDKSPFHLVLLSFSSTPLSSFTYSSVVLTGSLITLNSAPLARRALLEYMI